jgi:hypothetical protein
MHLIAIYLGCKSPGRQDTQVIIFYTKAPNICATSVKNLLNVTLFLAKIFVVAARALEICAPLLML